MTTGNDHEELPEEIAALLAREREAYGALDDGRGRVLAFVERRRALIPVDEPAKPALRVQPVAHPKGGRARWPLLVAAMFLVGSALGAVGARAIGGPATPPMPPSTVAPPVTASAAPAPASASASASTPLEVASARSPTATPSRSPAENLERERELLETARSALVRGRHDDALQAIERHGRAYPRGQLAEDREALAIQVLDAMGRHDEAARREARFHRAFPNSIHALQRRDGGTP